GRAGMSTMTSVGTVKDQYLADFDAFERNGAAGSPSWLRGLRQAAIARFAELGFPTVREEAWRYTSVAPLVEAGLRPARDEAPDTLDADVLARVDLGGARWPRLVFVDGRFSATLSSVPALPTGARVTSLAEALAADGRLVEAHLGRHAAFGGDGFTALNTAFARDGAVVVLPAGVRLPEPVHLVFVATAGVLAQPRTLVVAGHGSEATIVEHYLGLAGPAALTSAVTEVVVGDGALVHHYTLHEQGERAFHVGTLQVDQDRDSAFRACSATMGGRLVRSNLGVLLRAEGASCVLDGLYAIGGRQHVDNHVTVDHAAPRCASQQLYKGILDGRSRAVFNGRILVRRDAQKTDANQTNKTLLLAEGPEAYSKPQLEIFADDVRCTHGAAEGQLAEDAIFYLKSRGLREETARTLLTYGFAREVIDRIPLEPVRVRLDGRLLARLRHGRIPEETA
ncbi:MAG: Fe-S cluster assembly protein SufD, partial [Candidatus Rokuibacteriota bacterium]